MRRVAKEQEGKPMEHTYRVLAKGAVLAPDYERMKSTRKLCFIGRTVHRAPTVEALPASVRGAPIRARETTEWTPEDSSVEAWAAKRTVTVLVAASHPEPELAEAGQYNRQCIAEGGLWPADEATAIACGVGFDPTFGGDYPELVPVAATPVKGKKD